jgi:AcrR family transcriptional regulator
VSLPEARVGKTPEPSARSGVRPTTASMSARRSERRARLIQAGRTLMRDTGATEFTVPQVVAQARTSLRAFYENFANKEDLLLAVFAEAILETTDGLRGATASVLSPEDRLDRYVRQLFSGTFDDEHPETVPMIALHLRFATEQPTALAEALAPQLDLLRSILAEGARTNVFRRDTSPDVLAVLVSQLLVSVIHSEALTRELAVPAASVDDVVQFCRSAVLAGSRKSSRQVGASRRARAGR